MCILWSYFSSERTVTLFSMILHDIFQIYGFSLTVSEEAKFSRFLELFIAYNTHTNLSAIRETDAIIRKHFIDSLESLSLIERVIEQKKRPLSFLDIGSGGGFPWIPLAILLPEHSFTLLDSIGKKVRAMDHFIEWIPLANVSTLLGRAEALWYEEKFHQKYDIIVSRATSYITNLIPWCAPFLAEKWRIFLYKMPSAEEEHDMKIVLKKYHLRELTRKPYEIEGQARYIYEIGRV